MEVPIIITILVTIVSPFVTAYINKVNWSPQTKNLVALAVSFVIALGYVFFTGGIGDWSQLAIALPSIYGLSQAVYQFILKVPVSKFEAATRTGSVILTPTDDNTVAVTTTESIKAGDTISVDPPVTITPSNSIEQTITQLTTENSVKG